MVKDGRAKPKPRWPRKTIILTGIIALMIVVAQACIGQLHAAMRMPPEVVNFLSVVATLLIVIIWAFWLAFFSPMNRGIGLLLGVACLALPVGFYYLFSPVLSGDLGIARFDFKLFRSGTTVNKSTTTPASNLTVADLNTVTVLDFPQFLGPDRSGIVSSVKLATNWSSEQPEVLWKQSCGKGWSGFAAVNGFGVTMEQNGQDECVTCYEVETGRQVWRYANPQRHEDTMGLGKAGPRSTPTIDSGRVYAQGAAGLLVCLDGSTGKLIWSHDVCDVLNIDRSERTNSEGHTYFEEKSPLSWGRSGSPLVIDRLVYVPGGGPQGGPYATLLAFDKETGELAWKSGSEMIAYGSASFATVAGIPQVLLVAEKTAMGFDPATGKVLWSHDRPGSSAGDANCSQVTVASDSHVLLTKAYGLGGELLALEDTGSGIKVDSLWKSSRVLTTKFSNPVIRDGHAYALSDGFLECVNLKEGKMVWILRDRFGHGQLLLVDDMLVVHSEYGKLSVYPARSEKPKPLGKLNTVKGICWNTLCLYGDLLLVRSDLEMACIRLPLAMSIGASK